MITRPPEAAVVAPPIGAIGPRRRRWPIARGLVRPELLVLVLCVASFGARMAWLGAPCRGQCRSASDHVLVFDERYYVNAARVIAGVHPPRGAPYANAPLGVDPNAEQPPLVKLIIAGSIELFGDGPLAWRLGSVVIGTLAWGWLVDFKPIVYLNINPAQPAPGLYDIHPAVHFLGLISPPILMLALPALVIAAMHVTRWPAGPGFELPALAIAWFAGTFVPFVLLSLVLARTSYLYGRVAAAEALAQTPSHRRLDRGGGGGCGDLLSAHAASVVHSCAISAATSPGSRAVVSMILTPASFRIHVSWRRA